MHRLRLAFCGMPWLRVSTVRDDAPLKALDVISVQLRPVQANVEI
jgi:hypothetical protein